MIEGTTNLKSLAEYAVECRKTREQALRAAIREGTAVQVAGRWFVTEPGKKRVRIAVSA